MINISLNSKISSLEYQIEDLEKKHEERVLQEHIKTKEIIEKIKCEKRSLLTDADRRIFYYKQKNAEHQEELSTQKMIIEKMKEDREKILKEVQELNIMLFSTCTHARKNEEQLERVSKENEEKTQMIEQMQTEIENLKIQMTKKSNEHI
ncbi:uncharacterized protein LOC123681962 [Harmonia axyridis]|uniref:uncharacterized protein LOC123681962 n=1 Tax=Harmonia axyridis TaxID=115357 RepID=UPI001E279AC0|nr:uncharacterized protein LOC123681962 [Harmonia axyridis]